jgi:predicted SprT family Zn-dependent metalloprotease
MDNPTQKTYDALRQAYDFFNARLFEGRLPSCLITMQRKANAYGYFAGGRFGTRDGQEITDEIALNPAHFSDRSTEDSLSTLVHEMTHLEQHHFGKPSRSGYHNREWAGLMRRVGLIPTDTGAPGGKQVGQRMTHYIEAGGPYDRACAALMQRGSALPYVDLWTDAAAKGKASKKAASKTKYTCPACAANAWAKPDTNLICGDCSEPMAAEPADDARLSVINGPSVRADPARQP